MEFLVDWFHLCCKNFRSNLISFSHSFLHIFTSDVSVGTRAGAVSASGAVGVSLAVSLQTDAFVIDSTGARIQAFQTATNVSGNAAVTTNGMVNTRLTAAGRLCFLPGDPLLSASACVALFFSFF
jgi:hypothetical protein